LVIHRTRRVDAKHEYSREFPLPRSSYNPDAKHDPNRWP